MGGKKFDPNVCKTHLKLAVSRIKLQKNKKDNNIKNSKREIAELLKAGKDESARIKVENIIREDFIIEAYEILELFCELLLARLGVIQISRECPADIKEAVSTVIYAAPRTDVKELAVIREQLISKFGREFAMDSMQNKDNCVNARVVHKLSIQTPENYLVFQYLNEIAKAYNLDLKADFAPEPIANVQLGNTTGTLAFPEPPKSNTATNFPSFPEPPKTSNTPSFPEPPAFDVNNIQVPQFNYNGLPGGVNNSGPPSSSSPIPPPGFGSQFQMSNTSVIPDFPSPPTNNTNTVPSFPNIPEFPTIPSDTTPKTNNDITLDFPTPPGGTSNTNDSVPDFDELTARFEKLKKRDS